MADMSIERHRTAFLPSMEDTAPIGRVRMLEPSEALDVLADLYERVRLDTPGTFVRSPVWWERHRLRDVADERHGGTRLRVAIWEMDGSARAYAIWRVNQDWNSGAPASRLHVYEAVGLDPVATREIWRFVFGVDLVSKITAHHLPVDDRIVLELSDRFRPVNEGCWRLETGDGKGRCERTDDAPDLRLSVNDLGAAYLGATPLVGLARAGRVTELRDGAVARADALFRWHRAPWCPEIF